MPSRTAAWPVEPRAARAIPHRASVPGAVLGGFVLGLLETFATGLLPSLTNGLIGTEYRDVFAFGILILVLLLRPAGLLGSRDGVGEASDKKDF